MALNTIVAESLDYIATELEKATGGDAAKLGPAVQVLLKDIITQRGGDLQRRRYSAEWHAEAAKRGLPNNKQTIDALPAITDPAVVAMFEKYGVLSKREVESRREIYFEQYVLTISVEARISLEVAKTIIYPAAVRYAGELAGAAANLKAVGAAFDASVLNKVSTLTGDLLKKIGELEHAVEHLGGGGHGVANPQETGDALCEDRSPRDFGAARRGGHPGRGRRRRPLAVADLPGNAVHQVSVTCCGR